MQLPPVVLGVLFALVYGVVSVLRANDLSTVHSLVLAGVLGLVFGWCVHLLLGARSRPPL